MPPAVTMLVENGSGLREMYSDALKRHDFNVVECSTGVQLVTRSRDDSLGGFRPS